MNTNAAPQNSHDWFLASPARDTRLVAVIADAPLWARLDKSQLATQAADLSHIHIDQPNTIDTARTLSAASDVIVLLDAGGGISHDIRRHICLTTTVGPVRLILAIDGLDDSDGAKADFEKLGREFAGIIHQLGTAHEPVAVAAPAPGWYQGPSLRSLLETGRDHAADTLRAQVKVPSSSDQLSCLIVAGQAKNGDAVKILPGGQQFEVIGVTQDTTGKPGSAGSILTISAPASASAGDVVCAAGDPVVVSDQFEAQVTWFGSEPMLPGRPYLVRIGSRELTGDLAHPKHVIDVDTLEHLAAKTLERADIAVCNLSLEDAVPFTPFSECRALGGFTVIDKFSGELVGAGAINFALRRASNIHWQALDLNKSARAGKLGQKSSVLWFTGLSGSGKSTIANVVEKKLHATGYQTYLLDGDNVRHGLNRDLGFTDADRVENIRRVAEVARLMADAGLIVLVSFISPFKSERRMARDMMEDGEFIEVYIDTPLEVCEQRDVKGLYVKARRGEIKNFTGIDSDYELPELADIILDTTVLDPVQSAEEIIQHLDRNDRLRP